MATPTNFREQNDLHQPAVGPPHPVWIRETMLGSQKTIETISAWQLSPEEIASFEESGMIFLRIVGGQPPCEIFGGDPVPFEGQNRVYTHPDCRDLPVFVPEIDFVGAHSFDVTSAWLVNDLWREEIKQNAGVVFLRFIGHQPPGVEVLGINPI